MTSGQLRRRFDRFNREFWDNALARPERFVIVPAGQRGEIINGCSDWGGYGVIGGVRVLEMRAMDASIDKRLFNGILLHEMTHVEIGVQYDHTSTQWRQAVRRLSRRGALKVVI